jgi:hypothetical protein
MAGQTEQAAGTDISPMRSWFVRHPIATFLVLVYATTTALVFCSQRADRAGTSPWRSDTARGTGECHWVGCASIYCYLRAAARSGPELVAAVHRIPAGPRPAQLLVVGVAALVSDLDQQWSDQDRDGDHCRHWRS